jgi:hypothetical protein
MANENSSYTIKFTESQLKTEKKTSYVYNPKVLSPIGSVEPT